MTFDLLRAFMMKENRQRKPFVFTREVAEQINEMLDKAGLELTGRTEATERRDSSPANASESAGQSGQVG
jgi:hypothetical protein